VALTPNAACPYLYMERAHGGCTGVQANVPSPVRPSRPSASQASFSSLRLQHTSRTSGSPKHTTAWPVNEQRLSSHRRRAPRRQPPVPPRDRRRRDGHARPAAASRLHRLSRAARGRAQADQGRAARGARGSSRLAAGSYPTRHSSAPSRGRRAPATSASSSGSATATSPAAARPSRARARRPHLRRRRQRRRRRAGSARASASTPAPSSFSRRPGASCCSSGSTGRSRRRSPPSRLATRGSSWSEAHRVPDQSRTFPRPFLGSSWSEARCSASCTRRSISRSCKPRRPWSPLLVNELGHPRHHAETTQALVAAAAGAESPRSSLRATHRVLLHENGAARAAVADSTISIIRGTPARLLVSSRYAVPVETNGAQAPPRPPFPRPPPSPTARAPPGRRACLSRLPRAAGVGLLERLVPGRLGRAARGQRADSLLSPNTRSPRGSHLRAVRGPSTSIC